MENSPERMGVFPPLMRPAKLAVEKMLKESLDRAEIEGKPGFFVAPRGLIDESNVFFSFEHNGAQFVIFEQEILD